MAEVVRNTDSIPFVRVLGYQLTRNVSRSKKFVALIFGQRRVPWATQKIVAYCDC